MDPKKIKEALLVDESRIQEEQLKRVKGHLGLDSKGGVQIHAPTGYGQKDLVLLYLIGTFYGAGAGLRSSDSATNAELAAALGISAQPLAARLAELRAEGKVEGLGRGENRIIAGKIPWILNAIESTKKTAEV